MPGNDLVVQLVLAVPGILIALVFHEYAHARVAHAFGDPTPRLQGRLTLDPRAHLDWLGVIVLLMSQFQFGWARPVEVNVWKLRPRVLGELAVALAGIAMNLLLAVIFGVLAGFLAGRVSGAPGEHAVAALGLARRINLWLAIFNFLPVPPLDGWRFFRRLIPGFARSRLAAWLDQFGMFALMLLILFPTGHLILGFLLRPIAVVLGGAVQAAEGLILGVLR